MTAPSAYFVLDTMTGNPSKRIVSGPFTTAAEAEAERRELNIADDCVIVRPHNSGYAFVSPARTPKEDSPA